MNKSFCIALITCSSLSLIPTACSHSQTTNLDQSALAAGEISTESIQETAWGITVQIIVNNYEDNNFHKTSSSSGSGVLIAKSGNIYTVVTNAHVIGDNNNSYRIKTFDGKTHDAELKSIKNNQSGQKDLVILQFQATEKYSPASLGDAKQVKPNQPVFTSGFADDEAEITFNSGKVGQISQKPLRGGYQIGFTNSTKQGMSGGALLNNEGKVIGILGMGAAAVLDNAYTYADGSRPDAQMLEKLRANGFAVPVASLTAQNDLSTASAITKPAQSSKYRGLVGQVDSLAQQITVKIDSKNNGNGSGVIVAHDGDTYYVVTAGHVVTNEDNYTIVAPGGQSYPIDNSTIKTAEGKDLAVVEFTSQASYSTATIAEYINKPDFKASRLDENLIFVSGFPGNQRKINLTGGRFAEVGNWAAEMTKDSYSLTNGNGLLYTNTSLPGMSGGAVLDSQGRLIGINTGAENEYVVEKTGQYAEVALGYSLGVSSNSLLSLAKSASIPSTALKQDNSLPLELTKLEINSIKEQLFAFKAPGKNATETDWLNYGNQLWRAGENDKAVVAFDRAIALNPQEYRAYYGKGLASADRDKQIDAFKQVTKLNPDFYAAWQQLAVSLLGSLKSQNKTDLVESLAAYNRAIQLEPKIFSNYDRRGTVLKNLKRYDEAIASYNQAIKLKPDSLAYRDRGDVYLELEKYQSAIADYNQAKKLNPALGNDVETNNNIGIAYNELEDYKSAIAILSQAIKQSDSPQDSSNSQLYGNRGNAYSELKDYQAALADYNQAIKLAPSFAESYLSRALFYYDLKNAQKGDHDVEKGIQLLKQSIYDGYSDKTQLEDIANAFKHNGKPEVERKIKGLIAYSKAINLTNQGSKLGELNKDQEAINLYTKAITIDPQYRAAYSSRGASYYHLKKYQLALKDYNQAIKIEPKSPYAYVFRSFTYRKLKDYRKALRDTNQAILLNPKDALAYLSRGYNYYFLNQQQEANQNWQKAAELYSDPSSFGFEQEDDLEYRIKKLQQGIQQAQQENDLESYHATKAAVKQFQVVYYTDLGKDFLYGSEAIYGSDSKAVPINKQKAIEFFTKAITLDDRYVDAYVPRGSAYKDLKNYPKAIADLEKIIELTQDPWVYRDLANLYIDLEDYQSALSTFTKAIAVYPDSDIYGWRADLYLLQLKDYPKAIADYTKTIENRPELSSSYLNRGRAYLSLKYYKSAIADFNKAIKLWPEYGDAYRDRGNTYSALQNHQSAIKDLTKAIEVCNKQELNLNIGCPTPAQLYLDRSVIYSSSKKHSQALADLNKVISLEPKNADAYLQRGSTYYALKDDQKANKDWQTAAKLYKQQGNWQSMFTKLQKQAQVEKQKGDLKLYRKVKQVIKVFKQFQ